MMTADELYQLERLSVWSNNIRNYFNLIFISLQISSVAFKQESDRRRSD